MSTARRVQARMARRVGAATLVGALLAVASATPALPDPHDSVLGRQAASTAFRDQNVLVGFHDRATSAERVRALSWAGGRESRRFSRSLLAKVAPGTVAAAVAALRADPAVRFAEPDWIGEVAATPDDPAFAQQWGLANTGQTINGQAGSAGEDIGAQDAWELTTGSADVVVGVVDTGVDYTHPDLAANVWSNPTGINGCPVGSHGYNALDGGCDPMDDDAAYGGHGTHVAGIIGAVGNNTTGVSGVSWRTTVLPVKTVSASGFGTTSDLLEGLDWLLRAKQAGVNLRVINDSQTWKGTAYSHALREQIELLGAHGILFVSAGGNTQDDNDDPGLRRYPCGYVTPASLCAAATTSTGALATFANRGATTVDLGAPGEGIYSTLRGGGFGWISGSSMAAAAVSGAAALVLAHDPDLDAPAVKEALLVGAERRVGLDGLVRTASRLDACGALTGCSPPAPPSSATAGKTTVGSLTDTMSADRKRVNALTLPVAGELTALSAYLAPTAVLGSQSLTGVVYGDAGGSPGPLLARTAELTFSSSQPAGWYSLPLTPPVTLPAGSYWIGLASGGTSGVTGFRWSSLSGSRAWNSAPYAAGPSDPFGAANRDAELMSLYATYTPTAPATPPPFAVTPPVTTASGPVAPTPTQGLPITATSGAWAHGSVTVTHRWARCSNRGTSCVPIAGATAASYTPGVEDVGKTLQALVTATSGSGVTTSASPPSLVVAAAPQSSTPGVTTVGAQSDRATANRKRVNMITLSSPGRLTSLMLYLERTGTKGSQELLGVLYADSGSGPAGLVAVTAPLTFSSTQAAGWYELRFPSPVAVGSARFWIGFLSGRNSNVAGFRWTSSAAARAFNSDSFSDGPTDPFGPASTDAELMSLYATWSP